MSLTPYSPWLCLTCGHSQRHGLHPATCCEDRFVIRVMLASNDWPAAAADRQEATCASS